MFMLPGPKLEREYDQRDAKSECVCSQPPCKHKRSDQRRGNKQRSIRERSSPPRTSHHRPWSMFNRNPAAVMSAPVTVTAQAEAVAFIDNFKLMMFVSFLAIPLVILVQRPRRTAGRAAPALH